MKTIYYICGNIRDNLPRIYRKLKAYDRRPSYYDFCNYIKKLTNLDYKIVYTVEDKNMTSFYFAPINLAHILHKSYHDIIFKDKNSYIIKIDEFFA